MEFEHTFSGVGPRRLAEEFVKPDFLDELAAAVGVDRHRADVTSSGETVTTVLNWVIATDGIPGAFRRLIPAEVHLVWTSHWQLSDAPAVTAVQVRSDDPQASFEGTSLLRPGADGNTTWQVAGELTGKARGFIPVSVVRGLVEQVLLGVLKDQVTVIERRLDG